MSVPNWQFILSDLTGTTIGELLSADSRVIGIPLGRTPTIVTTVPLWHTFASQLLDTDTLLRGYRTGRDNVKRLVFHGPVVSAEEVGDSESQTIAVSAAGPFWRFGHRIIPGTDGATGFRYPATGTADLGSIAQSLLTTVNGATYGYTGVSNGSNTATAQGVASYDPGTVKFLGDTLTELSTGVNSFEMQIVPTEPISVAQPWPQIGVLNTAPLIGGVTRSDAVFEYGTTHANVSSYKRTVDRSEMDNSSLIWSPDYPGDSTAPYRKLDSTSAAARGLFEDFIDNNGITDATLRAALADEHTAIRKDPRQVITFVPAINAAPEPFVDYNVGDFVRARAVVRGIVRFDGVFRIWGVTFTLDKNGNESVALELQTP